MKNFKTYILESAAPKKRVVFATGVNNSGKTTVTYDDGTSETLTGPRPIRNNNPGNLESGSFSKSRGAVGDDGRYAVFPTPEIGWKAKIDLLKTGTYQNLTIKDAFNRYAPPSENPNYLRDLQSRTGFDLNRKMSSLNEDEFEKLVDAVAIIEGSGQYVGKYSTISTSAGTPPDYIEGDGSGAREDNTEASIEMGTADLTPSQMVDALTKVTSIFTNYGLR
jgi:hypothetical protein